MEAPLWRPPALAVIIPFLSSTVYPDRFSCSVEADHDYPRIAFPFLGGRNFPSPHKVLSTRRPLIDNSRWPSLPGWLRMRHRTHPPPIRNFLPGRTSSHSFLKVAFRVPPSVAISARFFKKTGTFYFFQIHRRSQERFFPSPLHPSFRERAMGQREEGSTHVSGFPLSNSAFPLLAKQFRKVFPRQ